MKIYGWKSRPSGVALCRSCRHATSVRGARFGDDFIQCGALDRTMHFDVVECGAYSDADVVPLHELKETAWRWFDDRFVSPAEMMQLRHRGAFDDDDDPAPRPFSRRLRALWRRLFSR